MYIHQLPDWPAHFYHLKDLEALLGKTRQKQGKLIGRIDSLGQPAVMERTLDSLTQEATQSARIEGESFNVEQVRSSIARRLALPYSKRIRTDRRADGMAEVLVDAVQKYEQPMTAQRLFAWHKALFPDSKSGKHRIRTGQWRPPESNPMQVVSGPLGHETIHFEAPAAKDLEAQMAHLISWINAPSREDAVLNAARAHLWFTTLHPFEEGNGRLARALADLMMARAEESGQRYYSMSLQIMKERRAYYAMLEKTQKGALDITGWMHWYLECFSRALDHAQSAYSVVMAKAGFWERHRRHPLNARQTDMLNRLLDGFEGKLTSSKWAAIQKCSHDTALRDIKELVEAGLLQASAAAGRSRCYALKDAEPVKSQSGPDPQG